MREFEEILQVNGCIRADGIIEAAPEKIKQCMNLYVSQFMPPIKVMSGVHNVRVGYRDGFLVVEPNAPVNNKYIVGADPIPETSYCACTNRSSFYRDKEDNDICYDCDLPIKYDPS